MQVNKNRQNST